MAIIKNRLVKKFSTIPNAIITDLNITPIALRTYLYLISKPDGWQVLNKDVMQQLGIKAEETLSNAWKGLIETGWITRIKNINCNGQFTGGYDYSLNEYPNAETPDQEKSQTRKNPGSGKNQAPENTGSGETTGHNNTDMNNIINTDCSNREIPIAQTSTSVEEEHKSALKKIHKSAYSGWKQIAKDMNIKFTESEWDHIYGYVIAKPYLPPHEIKVALLSLDKWANEGLDIEDCLLTCQKYRSLQKPGAKWILDKDNRRQYGHAVIDLRNRTIANEEMQSKAA